MIFSRAAGHDYDWPAEVASIKISPKRAKALLDQTARFFAEEKDAEIEELQGMDGETWALEFMADGEYHFASVFMPRHSDGAKEFGALCERITKLAELSPKRDLKNDTRLELCDPANDDDFEAITLRPPDPLLYRIKEFFGN